MSVMHQSHALQTHEILALYGEPEDGYEDYEEAPEGSDTGRRASPPCVRDSQGKRERRATGLHGVYFSNQEYYWRLEELKAAHLRNMAELERMYVREANCGQEPAGEKDGGPRSENNTEHSSASSMPVRTLQRINSQEELYFHQTASASEQPEDCRQDIHAELELDGEEPLQTSSKDKPSPRHRQSVYPERAALQKQAWNQPRASTLKTHAGQGKRGKLQRGADTGVRTHSPSKVTVPKPFQMMVREEERKLHKVRTRSQVELENTLLRKELDELRECGKRFRASPAPAHTHLPLCEVVGRRPQQGPVHHRGSRRDRVDSGDHGNQTAGGSRPVNSSSSASTQSLQPFSFLEREKKRREQKTESELGNLCLREEQRLFKARPMPSNVYDSALGQHRKEWLDDTKSSGPSAAWHRSPSLALPEVRKETRDVEDRLHSKEDTGSLHTSSYWRAQRRPAVKKQIELSIEMVKEREWAYIDPLHKASKDGCNQENMTATKSDYISV